MAVTKYCYRTVRERGADVRRTCLRCCRVRRRQNCIPKPHTTTAVPSTATDWNTEAPAVLSNTDCIESSASTLSSQCTTLFGGCRIPRGRMSGLRTIGWITSTSVSSRDSRLCWWKRSLYNRKIHKYAFSKQWNSNTDKDCRAISINTMNVHDTAAV